MKKQSVLTVALVGLLVVLGASQAYALGGPTLKADVPFDFRAGDATWRAGEYSIQPTPGLGQSGCVRLRAGEGSASAFLLGNPAWFVNLPRQSVLVFNKYGNLYFLREARVEGLPGGWQLPISRAEREMTEQASRFEVVTVLARR